MYAEKADLTVAAEDDVPYCTVVVLSEKHEQFSFSQTMVVKIKHHDWCCCLFHESLMMHRQHTWHLRPGIWQKARSLLTWAVTDPVWYGCLFSSHGESQAKNNLTEPIPLQNKHVAVEFIMESFHPSGPFLWTVKISAQWCCVDTSYSPITGRLVEGWSILFLPV